jgi:hypothetical protein
MRNNIEHVRASGLRNFALKLGGLTQSLSDAFIIPTSVDSPVVYFLNPNGANRVVRLPELDAAGDEKLLIISNTVVSDTTVLSVQDADSVPLVDIPFSGTALFVGQREWKWLLGLSTGADPTGLSEQLREVTAAGAQVVTATEPGLIINKAVASPTPVTLPTVASRLGKPVRIVDWRGTVDFANPLTVTPAGGQNIANNPTWEFSELRSGGVILFPNTALSGWTIGA